MTDRETLIAPLLRNYDDDPAEGARVYKAVLSNTSGVADIPDVHINLGLYLMASGDLAEAEVAFRHALQLAPRLVVGHYNLGCLLLTQKRAIEAASAFEQVLALEPGHANATLNLANAYRDMMRRSDAKVLAAKAQELTPQNYLPASFDLFEAMYDSISTDASIYAKAKAVMDLRCAGALSKYSQGLSKSAPKPLRVGFVSGDLKGHPVGFFLLGCLPFIDKTRLSLHAFSVFETDDYVAQKLRAEFETWDAIANLSDEAAADLIAERQIDVLIDLSGHTDMNRLSLFARRAAPVQISWLGWYATTGVVNMDYFLTDPISSPETSAAHHSEQLLYLPSTRFCMAEPVFAPPVSPLPALNNGYITFGSLQSLLKITDSTLRLWRQVLDAAPKARLHIQCSQFASPDMMGLFEQRLQDFQLPQERILLLPPVRYSDYFRAYQNIDLVLDTAPFSGGTTTVEALWMGVPTLTMLGNTLIARQGGSLMTAAGLADWVVHSSAEYVTKAVYWCQNLAKLAQLRANLREQVRRSPLFDGKRFAGDFLNAVERAYNAKLLLQPLRDI